MTFSLSTSQQAVVDHRGPPLQVIACAGSGKTESLSRRVASLIVDGYPPESIVAFTFTEKAAAELKERIYKRVEEAKGAEFLGRLGPMFVGTIHAYCFRILQDHVPKYGNYDVLDEHRHSALISRRRYELDLGKLHQKVWKSIDIFLRAADVIGNELIPPEQLEGSDIGECYASYRDMLDRYRLLTFGMIIAKAVEVLEQDPAVYDRVAGSLRHLIVDEYQDINPAQERLIELLAKPPVQLCVVGDDDQAIYQWRGSDVGNILKFAGRYSGVETVMLETNRRSRSLIVDSANAFAQSIPDRLPKKMLSTRDKGPAEVVPWLAATPDAEAEVIAKHIAALHGQGWRYQDIAVLFRSVRTAAPPLVAALDELPFVIVDRDSAKIWKDAVPLVSIRTLMMDDDYQQTLDGGTWDKELITWEGHPEFEEGMFVARVLGDAMEPAVQAGSYCLFRKAGDALPEDDIMLVRHPKINDPHYGGDWTVRKATFTGAVAETDDWKHGQIRLETADLSIGPVVIDLANDSAPQVVGELVGPVGTAENGLDEAI